jgi:hypothetical protein
MERPKVWVKDVGGSCVVETHNDLADDVRAALETAGLNVGAETPVDVRSNIYQFSVTMPEGDPISAANVRVLLAGNDDVEVMDE